MSAKRCIGRTKTGAECKALRLSDSEFCLSHDPRPEKRAVLVAGARRGGEVRQYLCSFEVPNVGSPQAIRLLLSRVMRETAAGRMPTNVAFVLNALSATALQAMRAEFDQREPGKETKVKLFWPWQETEAEVTKVEPEVPNA